MLKLPNSLMVAFALLLVAVGFPATAGAQQMAGMVEGTVAAASTVASGGQAPTSPSQAPAASTAAQASPVDGYRLGAADKVRIIVFNEPTLSGEFIVGDSGTLSLPLIGDVQASGRTPKEVRQDIESKFADGYLHAPHVSLDLLSYRPFYILGEVTKPGEYPYSAGLTVMNAVARAEGFTYRANKRRVYIKHAGEAGERQEQLTPDLQVYPGDTVRIAERYF